MEVSVCYAVCAVNCVCINGSVEGNNDVLAFVVRSGRSCCGLDEIACNCDGEAVTFSCNFDLACYVCSVNRNLNGADINCDTVGRIICQNVGLDLSRISADIILRKNGLDAVCDLRIQDACAGLGFTVITICFAVGGSSDILVQRKGICLCVERCVSIACAVDFNKRISTREG